MDVAKFVCNGYAGKIKFIAAFDRICLKAMVVTIITMLPHPKPYSALSSDDLKQRATGAINLYSRETSSQKQGHFLIDSSNRRFSF